MGSFFVWQKSKHILFSSNLPQGLGHLLYIGHYSLKNQSRQLRCLPWLMTPLHLFIRPIGALYPELLFCRSKKSLKLLRCYWSNEKNSKKYTDISKKYTDSSKMYTDISKSISKSQKVYIYSFVHIFPTSWYILCFYNQVSCDWNIQSYALHILFPASVNIN